MLLQCRTRGGNRKANDGFSGEDYVFIRGDALGRRKNLARRRLIGSVQRAGKSGLRRFNYRPIPFFFSGLFSWEIFPTRVDYSSRADGRGAGGEGRAIRGAGGWAAWCAESKRHNQPFSVVKALLKIMERISRSTNFFLYAPRAHRTPISSKTYWFLLFFFSEPSLEFNEIWSSDFFPLPTPLTRSRRPVKGFPVEN